MATRIVEHGAPARHRREYAETEKAERRLRKNRSSHADRRLHENWLHDIRQKVLQKDARIRSPERPCRQHIFHLLGLQNLGPRKTRISSPSGDDQRENHLANTGTEEGGKGDGEEDSGK